MLLKKNVLKFCTMLREGWKWKSFAILMGKIGANSPSRLLSGRGTIKLSDIFSSPDLIRACCLSL
jgi:hypothetical protein